MNRQAYLALKIAALGDLLGDGGESMLRESLRQDEILQEAMRAYVEALKLWENLKYLPLEARRFCIVDTRKVLQDEILLLSKAQ